MDNDSQPSASAQKNEPEEHGPPELELQVQTPRGLWSETTPEGARKRPVYVAHTKVATVIEDARSVFNFVEQDSQYELFLGSVQLEPQRTLSSYHLTNGILLVLSVQGGNAAGNAVTQSRSVPGSW